MSKWGIYIRGLEGKAVHSTGAMFGWVKYYDPNAYDGGGDVRTSLRKQDAITFDSPEEAILFWKQQSTVKPYREDGKPNRPLTAFTVEFIKLKKNH